MRDEKDNYRILVVEDCISQRLILEDFLIAQNYEVVAVENG